MAMNQAEIKTVMTEREEEIEQHLTALGSIFDTDFIALRFGFFARKDYGSVPHDGNTLFWWPGDVEPPA